MSQKRQQQQQQEGEEEGRGILEGNNSTGSGSSSTSSSHEEKRRKFSWKTIVQEAMSVRLLEPVLEPLIRRVVKEEIEIALRKHLASMKWSGGKEIEFSASKSLSLHFSNSLSLPVFTGARIEGEECSALKVILTDTFSGSIISSGPESSSKVEIVVLEGDFDIDESENWNIEEFKNNIVREREGKKPLLTGDVFLNLKDGVGLVGEISFTDNSSWTRSRKFRLGARVVDNFEETRVIEAKTESFIVRDHRGELYKKHHPPSLMDEVWRLEKIGKDGAFHKRLSRENIFTVKDFLTLLCLDPPRLRYILGTGMSAKMWEVTVEHARECMLDKRVYLYRSPQKLGVVFNIVGQVTGLLSESQCVSVDKLSDTEKVDAQNLVIAAFQHWEEVVSFDDEASLINSFSGVSYTMSPPGTENSDANQLLVSQKAGSFNYAQPSVPSPDVMSSLYSVVGGLDDFGFHNIDNIGLRYDQSLGFPQVVNSIICDTDSITQAFCHEDHLRLFDTGGLHVSQNSSHEMQVDLRADNSFLLVQSTAVATVIKAQRRWRKIFNVLQWLFVFWRRLERSRLPQIQRFK